MEQELRLLCKTLQAALGGHCCKSDTLSTKDAFILFCADIIIPENGEPVSSKDIKCCIKQIQELIISRLNQAVANKLISSVDYLRESFVGTLERCLKSLEESWEVSVHPARSLEKSKDVSVHITSNYLKQVWRLQWLSRMFFIMAFILIQQGGRRLRCSVKLGECSSGVFEGGARTEQQSLKDPVLIFPKSLPNNPMTA